MKLLSKTTIVAMALAASVSGASAKDWIEKVDLVKDGIDMVSIEVMPDSHDYVAMKNKEHRFLLRGYVSAKKNKRVAMAKFKSGNAHHAWKYTPPSRNYGQGKKRQVSISVKPTISLSKVIWERSPIESCKQLHRTKKAQGQSSNQILSKNHKIMALAKFDMRGYAMKPKQAQKSRPANFKWHGAKNATGESKGLLYKVKVTCLKRS